MARSLSASRHGIAFAGRWDTDQPTLSHLFTREPTMTTTINANLAKPGVGIDLNSLVQIFEIGEPHFGQHGRVVDIRRNIVTVAVCSTGNLIDFHVSHLRRVIA